MWSKWAWKIKSVCAKGHFSASNTLNRPKIECYNQLPALLSGKQDNWVPGWATSIFLSAKNKRWSPWFVNISASSCFWHETLFNFPRALHGLFFLKKYWEYKNKQMLICRIMLYALMLCIVTHHKTGTFNLTHKFSIFWHDSLNLLVNLAKLIAQELQDLKTCQRVPKKPVVKKTNKKATHASLHTQLNNWY